MRYIQTFTFLFKYQDWVPRVAFGMLISLIPIVGPVVVHGWFVRVMRLRIAGDEHTLPPLDFSDFGGLLRDGGIPFLVNLVFAVPLMGIMYVVLALMGVVFFAGVAMGAALQESLGDAAVVVGMGLGGIGALLIYAVLMVFLIAFGAALHVFVLRAEVTGQFGEAFKFGAVKENLRGMFKPLLIGNLVVALLSTVAVFVLYFIPFLGLFFAIFLMMAAASELRTMVYRDYLASGGAPIGTMPQSSRQ